MLMWKEIVPNNFHFLGLKFFFKYNELNQYSLTKIISDKKL